MTFDLDAGLSFDRVSRHFGSRRSQPALDALTLEIFAGGTTCLVGPNGAGKSTALALAAGLLATTGGEIRFGGRSVTPRHPIERFGYLPQQSSFPRALRVEEILDFAVDSRSATAEARDEVIELGDLSSVLADAIDTLSSGWLRRLGLAVALLEPIDLVLLDEPFVGLDLATLERTLSLLVRRASTGTTTLLCSHDFGVVDRLAPEVAVLESGRLLAIEALADHGALGSSREVYQRALADGRARGGEEGASEVRMEPRKNVAAG